MLKRVSDWLNCSLILEKFNQFSATSELLLFLFIECFFNLLKSVNHVQNFNILGAVDLDPDPFKISKKP